MTTQPAEPVLPRQVRGRGRPLLAPARRHPTVVLVAAAGCAASVLTVLAGGRTGTVRVSIPLSTWFGLASSAGYGPGGSQVPGLLLVTGIFILVMVWLALVRRPNSATRTETRVWVIAAAWAMPLAVGPPPLSSDVYTYAAQGKLVSRGLDPYSVGPAALGNTRAVAAVDPAWRGVPSPYGPLATQVEHLAVFLGGGGPLAAVIALRLLAVACVISIGLLAAELAGPRRIPALIMTVLNPLVLLQVVSAAHLGGLLCALLLGALVAARRGRSTLAIVLACAAAAVKAPALLAVFAIIAWQRQGHSGRRVWLGTARDVAVALTTCAALTALVPHGWGWINSLETPTLGYTPAAPASLIGSLFRPVVGSASFDDLSAGGRVTALLAAGCIVAYLVANAQRRVLEATVGLGLTAVALLSPVIYPWYLLWGALCLAPITQGRRRDLLALACAIGAVTALPGLPRLTADLLTIGLTACFMITLAFAVGPRLRRHLVAYTNGR